MSSTNLVQCPKCDHEFPVAEAILARINREAEAGIEVRVKAEREKMERAMQEKLQAGADRAAEDKLKAEEHAAKMRDEAVAAALKLEQERQANEAKLQAGRDASRQKSIDELMSKLTAAQKENEELAAKERLGALEARRVANEEAQQRFEKQAVELTQKLEQEGQLKNKELELQLGTVRKQLEEANKRANQGSMQNQGAALEASFEDQLRAAFPRDSVSDVPTGASGADVILDVFNDHGSECGRILFETKRTANWSDEWLPKLREDMHRVGATIGVIITQVMPRGAQSSVYKDGIWVADFAAAMTLVRTLRWGLQTAALQKRISDQAGDASALLYEFVTGPDFRNRVQSILHTYSSMRTMLEKERRAMHRIWKKREAQLESLTGHTTHVIAHLEAKTGREIDGDAIAALEDAGSEDDEDFDDIDVDTESVTPAQPVTDEQKQHLLATLEAAGGKSGNKSLRESLGWNESLYESVKAALIRDGSIEPGQGRGGSVKLVGLV